MERQPAARRRDRGRRRRREQPASWHGVSATPALSDAGPNESAGFACGIPPPKAVSASVGCHPA